MATMRPKSKSRIKPVAAPAPSAKTAKLFKNGRSQAVQLPNEFRFEGKEVAIRRDKSTGNVVLGNVEREQSKTFQEWFDFFDSLEFPEDFLKREVHMPVERDLF
jgi:antitoxin VapB